MHEAFSTLPAVDGTVAFPPRVIEHAALGAPAKLAYYILWNWAGCTSRRVQFEAADLARACGGKERSATDWIAALAAVRLVDVADRQRGGLYVVHVHAAGALDSGTVGREPDSQRKLIEDVDDAPDDAPIADAADDFFSTESGKNAHFSPGKNAQKNAQKSPDSMVLQFRAALAEQQTQPAGHLTETSPRVDAREVSGKNAHFSPARDSLRAPPQRPIPIPEKRSAQTHLHLRPKGASASADSDSAPADSFGAVLNSGAFAESLASDRRRSQVLSEIRSSLPADGDECYAELAPKVRDRIVEIVLDGDDGGLPGDQWRALIGNVQRGVDGRGRRIGNRRRYLIGAVKRYCLDHGLNWPFKSDGSAREVPS